MFIVLFPLVVLFLLVNSLIFQAFLWRSFQNPLPSIKVIFGLFLSTPDGESLRVLFFLFRRVGYFL